MKASQTHAASISATIGPAGVAPWTWRARPGCCLQQGVADGAAEAAALQAPGWAPCLGGVPRRAGDGLQKFHRISNVAEADERSQGDVARWRRIEAAMIDLL